METKMLDHFNQKQSKLNPQSGKGDPGGGPRLRWLIPAWAAAVAIFGASAVNAQDAEFLPVVNPVAAISSANLTDVVSDAYGNFYVTDLPDAIIWRIDAVTGAVTDVAGGATTVCAVADGATDALGDGCPATQATLKNPYGVRFYKGDMYIADAGDNYIRVVSGTTGIISIYAGTGKVGVPTAGVIATKSAFQTPQSIVFDAAGDLFVYCANKVYVSRIDAVSKEVSLVAGSGTAGTTGDGGPALSAQLDPVGGMAIDAQGNLYLGSSSGCNIRKVTIPAGATTGAISTYAGISGSCGYSGDGGLATSAQVSAPFHLVLDPAGNLFVTDTQNNRIREVIAPAGGATTGIIMTVAGNGTAAEAGDGGPAISASFNLPKGIDLTNAGDLVIADTGNQIIRVISAGALFAGTNVGSSSTQTSYLQVNNALTIGSFGVLPGSTDFSSVASAGCTPGSIVAAGTICQITTTFKPSLSGERSAPLIFQDTAGQILVQPQIGLALAAAASLLPGKMSTIAGTGTAGNSGDSAAASAALLNTPEAIAVDGLGNTYIADTANNEVREIAAGTGIITRVAGTGTAGSSGDQGAATAATLNAPSGVAVDAAGNLYIADTGNNKIRVVSAATGIITTFAGTGTAGYSGDGGAATAAPLSAPQGLAVEGNSVLLVADTGNNVVRSIGLRSNRIVTLAGTGTAGYTGDKALALNAQLHGPTAVAVDNNRLIYISDTGNNSVRVITGGVISTLAGTGTAGFNGDGAATASTLNSPGSLVADAAANIYVADTANNRIRRISAGQISTVAGTGSAAFTGDGGNSSAAALSSPQGLALDGGNDLVIADTGNNAVRQVTVSASSLNFPNTSPGSTSVAQTVSVVNSGNVALVPSSVSVSAGFIQTASGAVDCNASAVTLAPGAACQLSLEYSPAAIGNTSGNAVVTDNSQSQRAATQTVALTGTGAYVYTAGFVLPPTVVAGTSTTVTVSITNPISTYKGTIAFSSSDKKAVLPAAYTYSAGDAGSHTFTVVFETAGPQTLTMTDTATTSITATASTTVTGARPAILTVISGSGQSANLGTGFGQALVVQAFDAYGNVSPSPSVTFTAPSSGATASWTGAFTTTVTGNASGVATSPLPVADNLTGSYTVQAATTGVSAAASFSLTNTSTVAPSFSLSASPNPVLNLPPGSSASVTVTSTPAGGFNGTVSLSCATSAPGVTCQLASSSLSPTATGTPATLQATIQTVGPAQSGMDEGLAAIAALLLTTGMLFRKRSRAALLPVLVSIGTIGFMGCGGRANTNTSQGIYTVTITGTSGTLSAKTVITCYVAGVNN